jgi:hypothetical protein
MPLSKSASDGTFVVFGQQPTGLTQFFASSFIEQNVNWFTAGATGCP